MPKLNQDSIEKLAKIARGYLQAHAEKFKLKKKPLGIGATAAVFEISTSKQKKALKVFSEEIFSGAEAAAQIKRTELQKKLIGNSCRRLVKMESIELYQNTCICIMEHLPWPELKSVLSNVPEDKIQNLVDQLIEAIESLQQVGLIHRDIKPENILISPDFESLKLVDFGVAREISSYEDRPDGTDFGKLRPFLATAQYSPPEYLFRTEEPSECLWNALNIYQVGAVIHDLIVQKPLFQDEVESGNRYRLALAVLQDKPDLNGSKRKRNPRLAALAELSLIKDHHLRGSLVKLEDFRTQKAEAHSESLAKVIEAMGNSRKAQSKLADLIEVKRNHCAQKLESITSLVITTIESNFNHSIKCNRVRSESNAQRRVFEAKITGKSQYWQFCLEMVEIKSPETGEIAVKLGLKSSEKFNYIDVGTMSSGAELLEPGLTIQIFENFCRIIKSELETIANQ